MCIFLSSTARLQAELRGLSLKDFSQLAARIWLKSRRIPGIVILPRRYCTRRNRGAHEEQPEESDCTSPVRMRNGEPGESFSTSGLTRGQTRFTEPAEQQRSKTRRMQHSYSKIGTNTSRSGI
jgi:hypothetical protein